MATTEERLGKLENSVIQLASNKVDRVTLIARNNIEDTRYTDILSLLTNVANRLDVIEQWVTSHLASGNIG